MTEFKRAVLEMERMSALLDELQGLGDEEGRGEDSMPAPDKLERLGEVKQSLSEGGEMSAKIAKFEKRLTEKDPVSGALRYGEGMRSKVSDLVMLHQIMLQRLPQLEELVQEELQGHRQREAKQTEEERKLKRQQQREEEAKARAQLEKEAQERREQARQEGLMSAKRERLAKLASESREEKEKKRLEEERQQVVDRQQREREAGEMRSSAPVGVAGVEYALRRLEEDMQQQGGDALKREVIARCMRVLDNIMKHPEEPLYKKIRLENESFQEAIGQYEAAVSVLMAAGFEMAVEEGCNVLVMREPDLAEQMDEWTEWYDTLKAVVAVMKVQANGG